MGDDPGWALSGGGTGNPPSVLSSLRIIYLALVLSVIGFTLVVVYLVATTTPPEDPSTVLAIPAVLVGIVLIGLGSRFAPALDTSDADALVNSYRSRMIIRMALGEAPVLFAIVVFMLTFAWWMLAVVVVFGVMGLGPPAPTRASIEKDQQELVTQGSGLSLMEVLSRPTTAR